MDKNPKKVLDDIFKIQNEFSNNNPNIVLTSKPFIKMKFLNNLIESAVVPVVFLDFDLLYSGYILSGMIEKKENVRILRSNKRNFEKHLRQIIEKISKEQTLVILDSFNVLYNLFDDMNAFRFINSSIMLLASIAKYTKSQIVVTAISLKNENQEWVFSPGGKHLIDSKESGMYYLSFSESKFILRSIN